MDSVAKKSSCLFTFRLFFVLPSSFPVFYYLPIFFLFYLTGSYSVSYCFDIAFLYIHVKKVDLCVHLFTIVHTGLQLLVLSVCLAFGIFYLHRRLLCLPQSLPEPCKGRREGMIWG